MFIGRVLAPGSETTVASVWVQRQSSRDQNPQAVVDILTCSAKHKVGVSLERGGAASLLKLVSDVIRLNNPLHVVWQSHVHIFISQNVEPLKASTYPDMSVFGIAQALPCSSLKDLLHAMRVSRY
jgi:hypothetical protein